MEMNYCRRCGESLTPTGGAFNCANDHLLFANSAPTSAVFVFNENGNLLMSRRAIDPGKGMLDTFGGFVDGTESGEETAARELQEEAGLTPDQYEPLQYLCSASSTYLFQGEDRSMLTLCYWTTIKPGVAPVANDDVAEIIEYNPNDIDINEIFNSDVREGLTRLRSMLKPA